MNIISPLVQFQQQIRIFHWQTDSYSQHKAFGKTYENLDDLIDSFIETYMGIYGRSKPITTFQLTLKPLSPESLEQSIQDFSFYLKNMTKEIPDDSDLLNIRDSILGEVNHLVYLLSLK